MFNEFSSNSMRLDTLGLYDLSAVPKPTIKILLYTDASNLVVKKPVGTFGLGRMIAQLEAHAPAFANLSVKWAGRYSPRSNHADNKIHVVMAKELAETNEPFDQIWFFGLHQVNKAKLELGLGGGGPESELDADEVKALRDWMDQGGGVLVTGDHANLRPIDAVPPDPNSHCPDNSKEPFLSLGRALGRCIPRAGLLRDWEGSPTSREEDSNDSEVVTFGLPGGKFDDQIIFQRDRIPQQLILQAFDEKGSPSLLGQPHPLFFYKRGLSIGLFPDHLHEGQVTVPETLDPTLWRTNADGFRPEPQVVAYGLDKRSGRKFNLLVAYDGGDAGVGRIVADSTWHHYFNVNLSEFKLPANEGSASDQIGQFYGNLAVWLTPAKKRSEMADAMFRWLANEPLVVEGLGPAFTGSESDKLRSGKIARNLLAPLASPCEIHELLQIAIPDTYRCLDPSGTFFVPEMESTLSNLPSKAALLGSIIDKYPRQPVQQLGATFFDASRERIGRLLAIGADEAFEQHYKKVIQTAGMAKQFLAEARLKSSNLSNAKQTRLVATQKTSGLSKGATTMAVCAQKVSWEMELTVANASDSDRFTFIIDTIVNEVITGEVRDSSGNPTPLNGTCSPVSLVPEVSRMRFNFNVTGSTGSVVAIFLEGLGFQKNTVGLKPVFHGGFVAIAPIAAAISGLPDPTLIDVGDTGTGSGSQT